MRQYALVPAVKISPTPLKLNSLHLSFLWRQIMLCLAVGFVLTIGFGPGVKCLTYTSATDSTSLFARQYVVLAVGLWHETASFDLHGIIVAFRTRRWQICRNIVHKRNRLGFAVLWEWVCPPYFFLLVGQDIDSLVNLECTSCPEQEKLLGPLRLLLQSLLICSMLLTVMRRKTKTNKPANTICSMSNETGYKMTCSYWQRKDF